MIEWRGNRIKKSGNLPYFYAYFDYLDFVYSAKELQEIVNNIEQKSTSVFYTQLLKDKNYLNDLLGTKYLRENNLNKSLEIFKSIENSYWENNYNAWERDKYQNDYIFDKNPFYDFKFTERFIEPKETFVVTKLSVVEHLKKYINLAENKHTKDRAYYYFIIANCYYNMTENGHSWMLRRFKSYNYYEFPDNLLNESYIDQKEYLKSIIATNYYKKAMEVSKSKKFKALCLRMIDFAKHNTYTLVKQNYPEHEYNLSSCDNLEEYFRNR